MDGVGRLRGGHLKLRVKKMLDMLGVSGLRKRNKEKKVVFSIFAAFTAVQLKPLSNKTLPFSA